MHAQIIEPDNTLKQKAGHSSIAEDLRATENMQSTLDRVTPQFTDIIQQQLSALQQAGIKQTGDDLTPVYEAAHAIRGLAGSFELNDLGKLAHNLCLYIDALPKAAQADVRLIHAHINALNLVNQNTSCDDMTCNTVLAALQEAVSKATGEAAA